MSDNKEKITFILEDKRRPSPHKYHKIIKRETNDPIIFNGDKKVSGGEIELEIGPIVNAMRYVSKMTAGIATGVLSNDGEYIKLQETFIEQMIEEEATKVKQELERHIKFIRERYSNIPELQKKSLEMFRKSVDEVTQENSLYVFMNEKGECVSVSEPKDIEGIDGNWRQIKLAELKNIMDEKLKNAAAKKKASKKKSTKKKAKKNDRK